MFDFVFDFLTDPFIVTCPPCTYGLPDFFPGQISSFIALWSKGAQYDFSLSLLILVLWPNMGSVLETAPCALEENVQSSVLGGNVLTVSVKAIWSSASFKATVAFLIFCLADRSVDITGVLKTLMLLYFYP